MAKRIRRTPEEARRLILDAAEANLAIDGPGGLRLVQVAAQAGVSHPTILHHFGNREGLISALNRRTLEDLKQVLLRVMRSPDRSGGDVIGPVFAAYRNGLAQRVMWMLQANAEPNPERLQLLEEMVQELHALRVREAPGANILESDTRAMVQLTTLVAFGDAILGPRLRGARDEAEEVALRQRFERWFGRLLGLHAANSGEGAG